VLEEGERPDPDAEFVRQARRHLKNGNIGRGARALAKSEAPVLSDEQKLVGLRALHPVGEQPTAHFNGPADEPSFLTVLAQRVVMDAICDGCNGAAPGPNAWTEELLKDLMQNSVFASNFAAMITDLANSRVHPSVRERLCACDLVGIPKPDGGTRPITLGDTFIKIATRVALKADETQLRDFFGKLQYGVSAKNGCETIVHKTRSFIRSRTGTPACVGTIDFSNAFNTPERAAIWEVAKNFRHLSSIFRLEYGTPSTLRVKGTRAVIMSTKGTRQGTTGGPVFFSMVLQPILEKAARVEGVHVLAYMDDITILAENQQALGTAARLIWEEARKVHLVGNVRKCEIMCCDTREEVTDTLLRQFTRQTVLKILGASIGVTNEAEKQHLVRRIGNKFADWFRRARLLEGPMGSALLAAAGIPKLSFLLRTHEPEVTMDIAGFFDEHVENTWSAWAEVEPDDIAKAFAHLPVKEGGLGFTRQQQIALAAYTASVNESLKLDGPRRQELLTAQATKGIADWMDAQSAEVKRHRALNREQHTGHLFRDPTIQARAEDFSAALRLRLHQPHKLCPADLDCPGCGKQLTARGFLRHAPGCTRIHGENASTRHAQFFKNELLAIAHERAVSCDETEPRNARHVQCPGCQQTVVEANFAVHKKECLRWRDFMKAPRGAGPDIKFYGLTRNGGEPRNTVVDVTVVSMESESHAKQTHAQAFAEIERAKSTKYERDCEAADLQLRVAAAAENGTLSATTKKLLDDLLTQAERQTAGTAFALYQRLTSRIQLGTASALKNAERQAGIPGSKKKRPMVTIELQVYALGGHTTTDAAPANHSRPAAQVDDETNAAPTSTTAADTPPPVSRSDAPPNVHDVRDTPPPTSRSHTAPETPRPRANPMASTIVTDCTQLECGPGSPIEAHVHRMFTGNMQESVARAVEALECVRTGASHKGISPAQVARAIHSLGHLAVGATVTRSDFRKNMQERGFAHGNEELYSCLRLLGVIDRLAGVRPISETHELFQRLVQALRENSVNTKLVTLACGDDSPIRAVEGALWCGDWARSKDRAQRMVVEAIAQNSQGQPNLHAASMSYGVFCIVTASGAISKHTFARWLGIRFADSQITREAALAVFICLRVLNLVNDQCFVQQLYKTHAALWPLFVQVDLMLLNRFDTNKNPFSSSDLEAVSATTIRDFRQQLSRLKRASA
jgi:hypothetical protein